MVVHWQRRLERLRLLQSLPRLGLVVVHGGGVGGRWLTVRCRWVGHHRPWGGRGVFGGWGRVAAILGSVGGVWAGVVKPKKARC